MRSVEKEGSTVEEATEAALVELGAALDEVDVQVLRRPRRGLFGTRGTAAVRVTQRTIGSSQTAPNDVPTPVDGPAGATPQQPEPEATPGLPGEQRPQPRAVEEKGTEMTDGDVAVGVESPGQVDLESLSPEERVQLLDEECEIAADFVEGLLDLLDLPGDIEIEVSEDGAVVNVSDVGSGLLIGRRGATLDALQELVRSSTQRRTERRSQVRVDVEGYRARQLDKLRSKCRDAIAQVRETGEPVKLEPMDAYERKMMHDLVARTGGVTSTSEGAEPKRRVVILPDTGST